jgi:hypothetical protein
MPAAMPNKPRPRCPKDGAAMLPLFRKRVRGRGFMRAGDAFYCDQHDVLARGRGKRTKYLA